MPGTTESEEGTPWPCRTNGVKRGSTSRARCTTATGPWPVRGYATSLLLEYHRKNVKASAWRIKEWDYYLVNDDEYAVALTLSDMGYAGLVSVSLIDFAQAAYKTTSVITPFPFGRFHLPESSASGVSSFENSRVALSFEAGRWRSASAPRDVQAVRRRRRPDVRGTAGRGAARHHGDRDAVGRGRTRVLLQPEDRGHAGPRQFQEGHPGAWVQA